MKEVLKFSASWCAPCKALTKTISNAGDLGVTITEVDIDEESDLAIKYSIRSVPTLVMLENGSEVKRKTGSMQLPQLKEFLS